MKKYILVLIFGIALCLRPLPASAQILMTKHAKTEEQTAKSDEDSQEKSQNIEKPFKSPAKNDQPSPNGPFSTTNGSFSTNFNNPKPKTKKKTYPVKVLQDNHHRHKDHDDDRDDHRSHNCGYINISNVYLPAVPAIIIPADFLSLTYNGVTFYYNEGTFYQLSGQVLAPVKAPVGAIVSQIPADYSTIQIEGDVLYVYRDIFYKKSSEGFQVVETPEALRKVNP